MLRFTSQSKNHVLHFLVRTWVKFGIGGNVGNTYGALLRANGPREPISAHDFVRLHSFLIYTDLIE